MSKSTFDRLMADESFKKDFDSGYREFLLDELLIALMEEDTKSIREISKEVGLSKRIIQDMKSGKQRDMRLSNFVNIASTFGYHLDLVKGKKRLNLDSFVMTR
jgi:hypothetical protein